MHDFRFIPVKHRTFTGLLSPFLATVSQRHPSREKTRPNLLRERREKITQRRSVIGLKVRWWKRIWRENRASISVTRGKIRDGASDETSGGVIYSSVSLRFVFLSTWLLAVLAVPFETSESPLALRKTSGKQSRPAGASSSWLFFLHFKQENPIPRRETALFVDPLTRSVLIHLAIHVVAVRPCCSEIFWNSFLLWPSSLPLPQSRWFEEQQ